MAKAKTQPGLTPQLQARLLKGSDLPTHREFVEELFRLAGGPRKLAKLVWEEFSKRDASPMVRTRVLEMLMRSLEKIGTEIDPDRLVQQLPDDKLEEWARDQLKKLAGVEGDGAAGRDPEAAG